MSHVEGTVELVFVKVFDKPITREFPSGIAEYGGRVSIKLDNGVYYNFGEVKTPKLGEIFIKQGLITKGARIEFMFDESIVTDKKDPTKTFTYLNVKRPSVLIHEKGEPNDPDAPKKVEVSYTKKNKPEDQVGMKVGHAFICASNILPTAKAKDVASFNKAVEAIYKAGEQKLVAFRKVHPTINEYTAGQIVGNAYTCASIIEGSFKAMQERVDVLLVEGHNIRNKLIAELAPAEEPVAEPVKPAEAPEAPPVPEEAPPTQEEVTGVPDEDDYPF